MEWCRSYNKNDIGMLGVSSFYLYLMLIQEIHVFELGVEMNFQCMILPVTNAALVIAGKSAKFRWGRSFSDLNPQLVTVSNVNDWKDHTLKIQISIC